MKRYSCVLSGILLAALAMTAGRAVAAPDCGMNTGKAATGTPIPIGTVCAGSRNPDRDTLRAIDQHALAASSTNAGASTMR